MNQHEAYTKLEQWLEHNRDNLDCNEDVYLIVVPAGNDCTYVIAKHGADDVFEAKYYDPTNARMELSYLQNRTNEFLRAKRKKLTPVNSCLINQIMFLHRGVTWVVHLEKSGNYGEIIVHVKNDDGSLFKVSDSNLFELYLKKGMGLDKWNFLYCLTSYRLMEESVYYINAMLKKFKDWGNTPKCIEDKLEDETRGY